MAITRAKRRLLLTYSLAEQLVTSGMWDSLALLGESSDPTLGPNMACVVCDSGVAEGGGEAPGRRLLFAGSGWHRPICGACAGGSEKGRGQFPYASELFFGTGREPVVDS